jgi:hypothetical protein
MATLCETADPATRCLVDTCVGHDTGRKLSQLEHSLPRQALVCLCRLSLWEVCLLLEERGGSIGAFLQLLVSNETKGGEEILRLPWQCRLSMVSILTASLNNQLIMAVSIVNHEQKRNASQNIARASFAQRNEQDCFCEFGQYSRCM